MKQNVVIYTSDNSDESKRLKKYLDEWNIEYEERNISHNSEYLNDLQDQGIFATPSIFIENYCIQGVQPEHLKSELNIN